MLRHGDTDALVVGFSKNYSTVLKPVLEVIDKDHGVSKVSAMMMIFSK